MTAPPLLDVRDLRVSFGPPDARLTPVDGVSFTLAAGETLGIVGESGSGKSTLGLALMGMAPAAPAARIEGSVRLEGRELVGLPERALREVRGRRIAMILQDPMASLNPVVRLGAQVAEAVAVHEATAPRRLRDRVLAAFEAVRIPSPRERMDAYPHQISGGMRQRVVGAAAIVGRPSILVADEPTTSLDVTIQAQYLDLLRELRRDFGMAIVFITHDFGVVAKMCDRVAVMYAGRIVECAPVRDLFRRPRHWYSAALLSCVPRLADPPERLDAIAGTPPRLGAPLPGCRFAPRCPAADAACAEAPPETVDADGATVRCWHPRGAS